MKHILIFVGIALIVIGAVVFFLPKNQPVVDVEARIEIRKLQERIVIGEQNFKLLIDFLNSQISK